MRNRPGERCAVHAVARHRVQGVGNREDPRPGRNLLAYESVRVAVAVPALVVRAHDVHAGPLQQRDAREHLLAEDRVGLHQRALRLGERCGLLQHPVRDADLADVVQQEPVLGRRIVRELGVHRARELERVALHALRVRAGARVLRLQGAGERGDGLPVGLLNERALRALDLQQVAQVARVQEQLLPFAADLLRRAERNAVETSREPLDHGEQLERAEGLRHERLGAGGVRGDARATLGTGEQDDGDATRLDVRLQLTAELEPVHAGHHDVEHDHVGRIRADQLARLDGSGRLDDVDVEDVEGRAQQRPEPRVVVDEQHPHP